MRRAAWWLPLGLGLLVLYLPLLAAGLASVNASRHGLSFEGFTLTWYRQLLVDPQVGAAARTTLVLALVSTALSTLLGTLLALGLQRAPWSRRASAALDALVELPVVTPDIVFAACLVIAFSLLRGLSAWFQPGLLTLVLGHVTFQVAFVALVVRARLVLIEGELSEAARDLYADGWSLLRRVTLPLLWPAILAGALLAFTLSLDDFVISFFCAGPDSTTLPIYVYASLRRGLSPTLHALSTLSVLLAALLVLGLERVSRPFDAPEATP
ncbi:MAG: ABC transporter permease [Planctomycetes bacterium]|nr:ABC transporter permease [Planctomycetota bacterium]